ncbi:hypothetical protein CC86DRAFT_375397 [Ophiobolus disseminans]|uniref:Uncharacterized protein n=1 Tax=Ophiobolus disseminans TaxID=1469910 RepID=A0A6A6ZFK0_9PLEO|nr:hypothetical protein CC86DRAFT_375397 [Ophiobolus disseminans]
MLTQPNPSLHPFPPLPILSHPIPSSTALPPKLSTPLPTLLSPIHTTQQKYWTLWELNPRPFTDI